MSLTRKDLELYSTKNILFKIFLYTRMFKDTKRYHEKLDIYIDIVKCRVLHPVWFIVFLYWIIAWIFIQWIPETYKDIKKEFILF